MVKNYLQRVYEKGKHFLRGLWTNPIIGSKTYEYLKNHPLFKNCSREDLVTITDMTDISNLEPNTTLIKEGDRSRDMYIIMEGEVSVSQWDSKKRNIHHVTNLKNGDIIGEMAFADGEPRTSTLTTLTDCKVLTMPYERINKEESLHNKIIRALATINLSRLRVTTTLFTESLQNQLKQLNRQHLFGVFSITMFFLITINNLFDLDWSKIFPSFIHSKQVLGWTLSLLILVSFILIHVKSGLGLKEVGITTERPLYAIGVGIVFYVICTSTVYGVYRFLTFDDPSAPGLLTIIKTPKIPLTTSDLFSYFILASIQEYAARSVVQTFLQIFLNDKWGILTVLLLSYMFGIAHLHRGLEPFIFSMLGSIPLGLSFLVTRNLLTSIVFHYLSGFTLINWLGVI
jgi:CRP-like cAMP-binding protein